MDFCPSIFHAARPTRSSRVPDYGLVQGNQPYRIRPRKPDDFFGAGAPADPVKDPFSSYQPADHQKINQEISSLLDLQSVIETEETGAAVNMVPTNVIACNLWMLAAEAEEFGAPQAWYGTVNDYSATIQALKERNSQSSQLKESKSKNAQDPDHPINHYLLLPTFDWGIADWHLEVIRPFVKKHLATVGFSLDEALLARNVTIIGNHQLFSDAQIEKLILSGCKIRRIVGDGTSIATQLAER